ncbi:MAG: hypothetical protein KDK37_06010, partial [Leptospiraceae bacterium]|nr:hypothetical protein [Leptospiraceae bacterium]
PSEMDFKNRIPASALLCIGLVLMLLSDMRGSAGVFAWLMPVPFLLFIRFYSRGRHLALLGGTLLVGSILTLLKAASEPIMFSVPFAILSGSFTGIRYFLVFILWGYLQRNVSRRIYIAAFPALIVAAEYLQAFYSPLGVWGSLANTQLYNLPLLQTASIVGFLGISAMVAWGAVLLAELWYQRSLQLLGRSISLFAAVFIALNVFGDLRLDHVPQGPHIRAAAITSGYKFDGNLPNPGSDNVLKMTDQLLEKTRTAAKRGASLVVWGEGSTIVSRSGEANLMERISGIAKANKITIAAAYAVLPEENQTKYRFENKITWVNASGEVVQSYFKHHPVPGEGSLQGTDELQAIRANDATFAGAICYDYDFPEMPLDHAKLGTDLVALPGLDWRGMLRRHTLMARLPAIEGGFSLIRPANGATSMGFDNYGQIRAAMTDFGNSDHILIASLPARRIDTIYSHIGNILAYAAFLYLMLAAFLARRREQ